MILRRFCRIVTDHWLAADYGYCGGAELNGDGVVDWLDVAVFVENWLDGIVE